MKRLLLVPLYAVVSLIGCFVLAARFAKVVAKNLYTLILDGCAHRQLTWPIGRRSDSAAYTVCLQCGRRFLYDWPELRAKPNVRRQNQVPERELKAGCLRKRRHESLAEPTRPNLQMVTDRIRHHQEKQEADRSVGQPQEIEITVLHVDLHAGIACRKGDQHQEPVG